MILSFWIDRSGQTVQTQIRLIRVYNVCHFVCIFGHIYLWLSSLVQILGRLQQMFVCPNFEDFYDNSKSTTFLVAALEKNVAFASPANDFTCKHE